MKVYRDQLVALLPRVTPKPWGQFFSLTSFEKPLQLESARARAVTNFGLYSTNYGILASCCTFFAMLTSPVVMLIGLLGAALAVAYRLDVRGITKVVDQRAAYAAIATYGALFLVFTNVFEVVMFGLGFGAVACVLHCTLHDAPEEFSST